jgi:hypothetical protein
LKCFAECPSSVVVDLTELSLPMPSALAVFLAVQQRTAIWPAVPLRLVAGGQQTAATLASSVLRAEVEVCPSVADALAEDRPAQRGRTQLLLRPTIHASAQARALTTDACEAWSLQHLSAVAAVITTELVDNAATHARTDLVLTLAHRGEFLHISVADGTPTPARLHRAAPGSDPVTEPCRGLRLVDAFATGWGTLPTAEGKTTWAILRTK